MPNSKKISLIDYARLAADVRARQERQGVELKQIAAESGVDKSKLSILVNLKGGLATDNLLLICDWLGKSLYDYRTSATPAWVVERIAEANKLSAKDAEQLATRRREAAHRHAAALDALEKLDVDAVVDAVHRASPAPH